MAVQPCKDGCGKCGEQVHLCFEAEEAGLLLTTLALFNPRPSSTRPRATCPPLPRATTT